MSCPLCLQELEQNLCITDCGKGHANHYKCVIQVINEAGIKKCLRCHTKIRRVVHDGQVKMLPAIDTNIHPNTQLEQLKCEICGQATLDKNMHGFDKVVCCDGCDDQYVHKKCWFKKHGRRIKRQIRWFGSECRQLMDLQC